MCGPETREGLGESEPLPPSGPSTSSQRNLYSGPGFLQAKDPPSWLPLSSFQTFLPFLFTPNPTEQPAWIRGLLPLPHPPLPSALHCQCPLISLSPPPDSYWALFFSRGMFDHLRRQNMGWEWGFAVASWREEQLENKSFLDKTPLGSLSA